MSGGPRALHCAILAGGAGRRLGGAKATIELAGKPLVQHVADAAIAAGLEPVLVAKRDTELPELDCGVIREPAEPRHPLTGVVAALGRLAGAIVVCPCDTPHLPPALLAALAARTEPLVVVRAGDRTHPLIGRYDPELLPALRRARDAGAATTATIEALDAAYLEGLELDRLGDPERTLANINTREDLTAARRRRG